MSDSFLSSDTPALSHPFVRDLYWAVASPELMRHSMDTSWHTFPGNDWFTELDRDANDLVAHMAGKNTYMLGTYFEALWEFYLTHNPKTDLLAKNIQVFADPGTSKKTLKARPTLGELDFVYYCHKRRKNIHLEVAVKYYLGLDNADLRGQNRWFGPQCNDRLDIKYHKMVNKQALLSQRDEGMAALSQLGIGSLEPEIVMKGMLFYPEGDFSVSPEQVAPKHSKGVWCRQKGLEAFCEASGKLWYQLEKPFWMAEPGQEKVVVSYSEMHARLADHFKETQRPLLWTAFDDTAALFTGDGKRMFVVPDHWPFKDKMRS